jgi:hypothetical protein
MTTDFTFSKDIYCGACPTCAGGTVGICDSGTCAGGTRDGMACTPESAGGTSHDCPPSGGSQGTFGPYPSAGTTGPDSATSFATTGDTNIFCGYCYSGGTFGAPCTTDAECAPAVCTSNSDGAFRNLGATSISMTGSSAGTCVSSGAHPTTIVDVSCIASTGDQFNNLGNALPGPSASSIRGTIEIIP